MEEKTIIEQSHNKLYDDLLEVVKPYLSDFIGYDEKEQSFNIVLAIKELLGQLEQENEELKKRFNDYQDRKIEENANLMKRLDIADKKLTVFSRKLEQANKENDKYKQALKEIKNISDDYNLTVSKRREQIADIVNSLLEQE